VATGLPAGRYLAGRRRGLTLQPEPPEVMARGRDGAEGQDGGGLALNSLMSRWPNASVSDTWSTWRVAPPDDAILTYGSHRTVTGP
jgi:hypothetical protein